MYKRIPLAVFAISLLVAACSDDPEPTEPLPAQPPIIVLTAPDSVYDQLMIAVEHRSTDAYINTLAESFVFNPDPEDARVLADQTGNPNLFDDWDRSVEGTVHASIFDSFDSMELVFTGAAMDSVAQQNQVILIRKPYRLTADEQVFEGSVDLTMLLESGEWRIIIWVDHRWPYENPSWTVLRGEHR